MLDKNDMKMLREMMEATVKETVEATVKETVEATVQKAIEPLQQDICDLKEEVNGVVRVSVEGNEFVNENASSQSQDCTTTLLILCLSI